MFLAWANRLLALALTPLLRRFFCSAELPELGGLPLPLRFSPLPAWSDDLTGDGGERLAPPASLSGDGDFLPAFSFWLLLPESDIELVSDLEPELTPNILVSRPPWEERLRRLLPARLVGGGTKERIQSTEEPAQGRRRRSSEQAEAVVRLWEAGAEGMNAPGPAEATFLKRNTRRSRRQVRQVSCPFLAANGGGGVEAARLVAAQIACPVQAASEAVARCVRGRAESNGQQMRPVADVLAPGFLFFSGGVCVAVRSTRMM